MTAVKKLKKKYPTFRQGQIVRHGSRFGYVLGTDHGVDVRFPDPHNEMDHKDVNFHPAGTLLGEGERVLHIHQGNEETLAAHCRHLSTKIEAVNQRVLTPKNGIGKPEEEVLF